MTIIACPLNSRQSSNLVHSYFALDSPSRSDQGISPVIWLWTIISSHHASRISEMHIAQFGCDAFDSPKSFNSNPNFPADARAQFGLDFDAIHHFHSIHRSAPLSQSLQTRCILVRPGEDGRWKPVKVAADEMVSRVLTASAQGGGHFTDPLCAGRCSAVTRGTSIGSGSLRLFGPLMCPLFPLQHVSEMRMLVVNRNVRWPAI
jgi:hypothetical protein